MSNVIIDRLVAECSNANESPFGLWISALFSVVDNEIETSPLFKKKKMFLSLLKKLLDKGIVVTFPPQEFYKDGVPTVPCRGGVKNYYNPGHNFENIWDVSSDEVILYIRDHWPEDVTDANDKKLNLFWYENYCPRIGWYDEKTDSIIAS